jgi:hypothetical protein
LRNPIGGSKFRRDVKLAQRRGKDMSKLRTLILLLIEGNPLPPRYKDHPLSGDFVSHKHEKGMEHERRPYGTPDEGLVSATPR